MRTFWRLAFHNFLVAIIEWERWLPDMNFLPVTAHTLGMLFHSVSVVGFSTIHSTIFDLKCKDYLPETMQSHSRTPMFTICRWTIFGRLEGSCGEVVKIL
jgi:hypothetical protein